MLGYWAVRLAAVAALSYLLGGCNGAILVSKYILRDDIRGHGSGNAGLTNFLRVFGGKLTAVVILADILKIVLSILLGIYLIGNLGSYNIPAFGRVWAGAFCMLGHDFPLFFGFRGGKGVLSGGAMTFLLDWRVALACWGIFLLAVILTRYVSLGSVLAGITFIVVWSLLYPYPADIAVGAVCGILLVWGHRSNISRLIHGTENKLTFHKKGGA